MSRLFETTQQTAFDQEYKEVMHLFFHLREAGLSLSEIDLDILQFWEKEGIKPDFIVQTMLEIKEDCQRQKKDFPTNLEPIFRKVNHVLIKMREH